MSTSTLKLKIVTPERLTLEEDVVSVTLPTTEGEITILPGHVPLIASLKVGELIARPSAGQEDAPLAIGGGFVEVKDGKEVIVLASTAEHVSQIDIDRAKNRADELMKQKHASNVDFEHFEAELERSLNRVKVADKWRGKKYRKIPFHI